MRTLKTAVFFVLLLLGLKITDRVLYPDNGIWQNWLSFYEQEKNSIDVLVIGSSHAFCSFDTAMMDRILGEKTYILATNGQTVDISYYNVEEVLRYQSPKLIILEAFGIQGDVIPEDDWKKLSNTDGMRLGPVKLRSVLAQYAPKNRASALFTIIRSHDNWRDTEQIKKNLDLWDEHVKDFSPFRPSVTQMSDGTAAKYKQMEPIETPVRIGDESKLYFRKLAELCRQKGIELVVVMAPMYDEYVKKINYQSWYEGLSALCAEEQVEFIDCNLLYGELGMEQTDFQDAFISYLHLNAQGAEKFTRYIAERIAK